MPVQWTISHADRLILALAQVTMADIEHYFAAATARQWRDAQSLPNG